MAIRSNWNYPTAVRFGAGRIAELPEALKAVGLLLLVLPHAIGAPVPPGHEVDYPGALAGEFVIASLVVSAVLWTLAGTSAGWIHERLSRKA